MPNSYTPLLGKVRSKAADNTTPLMQSQSRGGLLLTRVQQQLSEEAVADTAREAHRGHCVSPQGPP